MADDSTHTPVIKDGSVVVPVLTIDERSVDEITHPIASSHMGSSPTHIACDCINKPHGTKDVLKKLQMYATGSHSSSNITKTTPVAQDTQ
jgi:hypothetical protein